MASVRIIPAVTEGRPDRRPRSNKRRAGDLEDVTKAKRRTRSGKRFRKAKDPEGPLSDTDNSNSAIPQSLENIAKPVTALSVRMAKAPARTSGLHDDRFVMMEPGIAEAILQALAAYEAIMESEPDRTPVGTA